MIPLEEARRYYAEEVRLVGGIRSPEVVRAFSVVERERYLGPGPWEIPWPPQRFGEQWEYRRTPDADPRHLCHNVLVAIDKERQLHNGLPSFLAFKIDAAGAGAGDRVVHVGCGVGYYTAIFAELVGRGGEVLAFEIDPKLAERSRQNLAHLPQVEVVAGDGTALDPGESDVIFVNAGATHPAPLWLDRLARGGRLILPLTHTGTGPSRGIVLRIERKSELDARVISGVSVFDCDGGRDPELNKRLGEALERGFERVAAIRSLRTPDHEPSETCWAHLGPVCLSTLEVAEG